MFKKLMASIRRIRFPFVLRRTLIAERKSYEKMLLAQQKHFDEIARDIWMPAVIRAIRLSEITVRGLDRKAGRLKIRIFADAEVDGWLWGLDMDSRVMPIFSKQVADELVHQMRKAWQTEKAKHVDGTTPPDQN